MVLPSRRCHRRVCVWELTRSTLRARLWPCPDQGGRPSIHGRRRPSQGPSDVALTKHLSADQRISDLRGRQQVCETLRLLRLLYSLVRCTLFYPRTARIPFGLRQNVCTVNITEQRAENTEGASVIY